MQTLGDLAFTAALAGAPLLVLTTCIMLLSSPQPRWVTFSTASLGVASGVGFVAYWFLWGRSFDLVDAERPDSPALELGQLAAAATFAVAGAGVVALWCGRRLSARKRRTAALTTYRR
ncbi:hypothetical protein H5V45_00555 [Nocardioides sp. KIGAM211]|uniref:Uncharacterized protein n=1 Tax=Nocardioides luti TaxID=2761101 RepID=A0A7X0V9D0_9ACTN|nr:hypothetical protein [Nocardioides luti]MBB6625797.1 hypothetical protein [Nocardioides luti]